MKKKVKLFSTIASLCLAVALMAFGVWAATSVSVGVTGTVQFTAEKNVKAKVTFVSTATNITEGLASEAEEVLFESANNAAGAPTTAAKTKALGDAQLKTDNSAENMVYTYTITFTNKALATDTYTVLNVSATKPTAHDSLNVDGYKLELGGNLAEDGNIALNGTATVIVTITMNPNRDIAKVDIGSSFVLTMKKGA